jgi:hypothetical protein
LVEGLAANPEETAGLGEVAGPLSAWRMIVARCPEEFLGASRSGRVFLG